MVDQCDKPVKLGNFVFDEKNQEQKPWKLFGRTCNSSFLVFLCQFFVTVLLLACAIVRIMLFTTCEETTVWVAFLTSTVVFFSTFSQAMNKLLSTKERLFISLIGPIGSEKSLLIFDWLKFGTVKPAFDKGFFYPPYQPLYSQMQRKNFKGVDFDMIENLPKNGTKYLLIFDDACEELSNSKQCVKIATVGRHKRLNTI